LPLLAFAEDTAAAVLQPQRPLFISIKLISPRAGDTAGTIMYRRRCEPPHDLNTNGDMRGEAISR